MRLLLPTLDRGRRLIRSAVTALGATVLATGALLAGGDQTAHADDSFSYGVVSVAIDGSRTYWVEQPRRGRMRVATTDPATGTKVILYTAPSDDIYPTIAAGGGRLAIETDRFRPSGTWVSAILSVSPVTGMATALTTGTYRSPDGDDCGRSVILRDVTSDGRILVQEVERQSAGGPTACGTVDHDIVSFKTFAADGAVLEISRTETPARGSIFNRAGIGASLAGGRLLNWTYKRAVVTDLATGVATATPRTSRRTELMRADLSPAGALLYSESRFASRPTRSSATLRLDPPGAAGPTVLSAISGGRVVWGFFCGDKIVENVSSSFNGRRRPFLALRDANGMFIRRLFTAGRLQEIGAFDCDGSTAVFALIGSRGRSVLARVPLS